MRSVPLSRSDRVSFIPLHIYYFILCKYHEICKKGLCKLKRRRQEDQLIKTHEHITYQ